MQIRNLYCRCSLLAVDKGCKRSADDRLRIVWVFKAQDIFSGRKQVAKPGGATFTIVFRLHKL